MAKGGTLRLTFLRLGDASEVLLGRVTLNLFRLAAVIFFASRGRRAGWQGPKSTKASDAEGLRNFFDGVGLGGL